jgi:hypothetical protein
MEEWVERMLGARHIVGALRTAEEGETRIAAVREVGHSLAAEVEDMLVGRIDLLVEHHMAAAEEVARMEAVEADMVADRTELGGRRKLAAAEDTPEEGIDLEAVDHMVVVARMAAEENLFNVSACYQHNRIYSRP